MMRRILVFVWLAAVMAVPCAARGQSLVDVAKAEAARRKAVKQPAKVITDDDLKPSNEPPSATASTQAASSAAPAAKPAPTPAPVAADDPSKTEKYWKDRITLARTTLDHDKVLVDAVQSRINGLTTEFVNTSDPAQRTLIEANRNSAIAELDRLNKDIQTQTKAITDIQEDARKASVPAGWLR